MTLQLLQFKPGIVKDITEYSAGKNGPFWVDGNLVRFKNGYPQKIGGWEKEQINALNADGSITSTETTIQGIARKQVFWRAPTDGEDRIAVGTHNHLYIVENGALYDITPLRDSTDQATATSEALDNSETGIDVVSVTGLKTAGSIIIGTEIISYTGISSLTLTGCTRGASSTTAAAHDSGAVVTQVLIGPIATVDESTTLTITDSGHGAFAGDFVVFRGAVAAGGITAESLNRRAGYEIVTVTTNTFTIVAPNAATSTVSAGGGNAVAIDYLIGNAAGLGSQTSAPALGWGIGGWGGSTWGTARSAGSSDISLENSSWDLDLWGEDLIATVRNGAIYYWDTSGGIGNRASLVSEESGATSVPAIARTATISFPDRHFIVGGGTEYGGSGNFDPMLVRWSNQEDFTVFAPTALNTAGDQRLQIGTEIITMVSSREETIISTDEAIYGMTFVGAPFIFSFRLLATNAGAAGLNTMLNIDGTMYWMGKRNFFMYNGVVKEIECPVQHYVFNRMQENYIDKTVVGHNKRFKEVTWFYVSNDVEFDIVLNDSSDPWTILRTNPFYSTPSIQVGDYVDIQNSAGLFWCGTSPQGNVNTFARAKVVKRTSDTVFTVLLETSDPTFGDRTAFAVPPSLFATVKAAKYNGNTETATFLGSITSVTAGVNGSASGFSDNPEPDSYVTFNYAHNIWTVGTMDRTCWSDSFGVREVPFAFDIDGYLYNHETGNSADGGDMYSYVESSPREITQNGERLYMVDKIIPDAIVGDDTSLSVTLKTKKYPNDTSSAPKGPYTIASDGTLSNKVSIRAKGRQMSMIVQSTGSTDEWTMGDFRFNAKEDSLR